MKTLKLAGIIACVVGVAACATVTRGTTNKVQILSEPSGAEVRTSLNTTCVTPCTFTVPRKDEFSVTISLPGYKSETVEIRTRVAGEGVAGLAGNVIIGGVIGLGTDAITGAALEHYPNPVEVKLQRLGPAPATAPKRR
ncbi:MAG: PEGA domain-containing protein [Beijerinckiaceae bacterium]